MNKDIYRFNLNLPMELKDYLADAAWENRTSITAYLIELVRQDKERKEST